MYRFRFVLCLILMVVLAPAVCGAVQNQSAGRRKPAPDATRPQAEAAGDSTYTVRIVFDGLVTLAVKDRSEHPKELWALLGNLSNPKKLDFGKDLPPHQSHLEITPGPGVHVSGRSTGGSIDLDNEDLTLVATIVEPEMSMVLNTTQNNRPCRENNAGCAREQQDFKWTVDLDLAASAIPVSNGTAKSFKSCLTHEQFDCPESFPILAARMKLDKGLVFVKEMQPDPDNANELLIYQFLPVVPGFSSRAMAKRVAVEMTVKGPVEIRSRPLTGGGSPKKSLFFQGDPGKLVEVVLANHSLCAQCPAFAEKDFIFNFNFLNQPARFTETQLPAPAKLSGEQGFNAQCSPGSYQAQ